MGRRRRRGLLNMKKIHLLESKFHSLILEAMNPRDIHAKYYSDIPWDDFSYIALIDPTLDNNQSPPKLGKYTKWMLGMYRRGTFKRGDFNEAVKLLPIFEKYKNRVSVKDVTQLHSMGELYQVVKPFMEGDQATSKSDAIRKAKQGAEKVYEDDKWLVVVPHTMEAAQIYGEHTKWCTAAEDPEGNMFEYYNNQGPLYINIDKVNNRKYQFHFESGQFMDEEDYEIQIPILSDIGATERLIEFYKNKVGIANCIELCVPYIVDDTQRHVFQNINMNTMTNQIGLKVPEAYLVWDREDDGAKCAFINNKYEVISDWFNDATPFQAWRKGHENITHVNIIATREDSIYYNNLMLSGLAVFDGERVNVMHWEDSDGDEYEPDWYDDGSEHGGYIVYSDYDENEDNLY